ncbi:Type I Iterative PKS [Diatrype stigma]|uniref:Type I Iterative PKS n=1 Tax=Diatrype stigma TaxID=117547 RepID=A0AAN9UZ27_9PEZI
MTVDQHMNTAKLGILSPTSTCHTFDASADGYGRAEGAGALYVKRLSDAIRDADPIRGIIRATAVNTNGKVEGMGITHPSGKNQERVVRTAYEKAGLDPQCTAYAELHGTGTPVGDPIEVRAISRALNDERPKDRPLLVGAVKPNIGHSEAASGIFAVMKTALMTEAAMIPGVALFKNLNPEILEKDWNVKVHANTAPWPKDSLIRRASVSSFGYGGTNGHVIVESADSLYPFYQHGKPKREANYDHSSKRPFLLCFSAHDKPTLSRNIQAIGAVAADYYTADLAYTLNLHRSKFSHRAFTIAYEGQETAAFAPESLRKGVPPKKQGGVGFIFTGQGAQWLGMGKVALQQFPIMLDTIEKLDRILSRLSEKPSFSLAGMLLDDSETNATRINDAEVAQPLCTAIQIALVDLFVQWNIKPVVSIGHSSGEIAAAYAAGLISAPEAIIAAFCRGRAVRTSVPGSMLAVGVGAADVGNYLADTKDIYIACENSPGSVTLSGDAEAIAQLGQDLKAKGVFAAELKTGRAYHSPYMASVGDEYDSMLPQDLAVLTEDDLVWRHPRSHMVSSVTGEPIAGESLDASYWSKNLRQRVLFDTAVRRMGSDKEFDQVTTVIEVGCHSALSRIFKQIGLADKAYIPSLTRNKDDADQLLSVAGSLFLAGYPVDLEKVNSDDAQESGGALRKSKTQYLLVDLPRYQWNYEKQYWAEPRTSAEQRARAHPRHDLLGRRVAGLSNSCKAWRNVLRLRDVPWLKDHNLGGAAIFPAAGYLSAAIEALWQVHEGEGRPFQGVEFRDVDIKTALSVPESDGIEIVVSLHTLGGSEWHTFSFESFDDGIWTLHCEGKISASHPDVLARNHPVDESALTQRVSGKRWYNAFHRVGFGYTNTFQRLQDARTERSLHHAAGDVLIAPDSGVMTGESRHMIHPSTIDACLHLIIISIHAGKHKEMPWGVVPTRIGKVSMTFPEDNSAVTGNAIAWTDSFEDRRFNTHTVLTGASGKTLLDIENLTCVPYEAAIPAHARDVADPEPFSVMTWKPDITTLTAGSTRPESLNQIVELVCHQHPVKTAMICGSPSPEVVSSVLEVLPRSCAVTVGFAGEQEVSLSESIQGRVTLKTLAVSPEGWSSDLDDQLYDMVLVHFSDLEASKADIAPATALSLVGNGGWVLGSQQDFSLAESESALMFDRYFALKKNGTETPNGVNTHSQEITILSASPASFGDQTLADILSTSGRTVLQKDVTSFSPDADHCVVIDDTAGAFLLSLSEQDFGGLKSVLSSGIPVLWLTQGVKEGRSAEGGMAEGFLRAIRSEQASVRVSLLDISHDEKPEDITQTIIAKLDSVATKDSGSDTEFWLHRGVLHIPRLYPRADLNREWTEMEKAVDAPTTQPLPAPAIALLKGKKRDSGIVMEPEILQVDLASDEVEIRIEASDETLTSGPKTLVFGTIVHAGTSIGQSALAKRVVAFSPDGTPTTMRTSEYITVDDTDAAARPEKLLEALEALQPLVHAYVLAGKMDDQSQVLALPGQKSTTAMLVLLAKALGFKLCLTAASPEEKQDYMSEFSLADDNVLLSTDMDNLVASMHKMSQKSSLSVITHDFSALAQQVWARIPASSRLLLLMNNPSVPEGLDCQPFMRGASFVPVSTKSLPAKPAAEVLRQSLSLIERNPQLLREPQFSLSHDGTYLLVGCLGGLGRSLTKWMMERGARHFAFISRSGADKPEAARIVAAIERSEGASAKVYRADAADEEAVQQIVLSLQEERPIRGVVHAAMVLKDGMFEQMDYASFMAAITPKARGALSLHKALLGSSSSSRPLDFFVMTSSISAVLGNMGQSNYSAANSLLDALARHRRTQGLAASSLALPVVLDVGVVAEDEALEAALLRKGLYGISEHEMLRGFEVAMSSSSPSSSSPTSSLMDESHQLVMGMETQELARAIAAISAANADLYWIGDARFCHVRAALEGAHGGEGGGAGSGGSNSSENFAATVEAARVAGGADAAVDAIAAYIAQRMSGILMIPADDFELDGPSLGSYGLDSMVGAEMRSWLFKEFGLDYPFQKLLARTLTFRALAGVVAEKMGVVGAGGDE